ncbi:hypothetical protein FIBSPDRAFT_905723 [Athelia psychrophila]|uniref:Uncharacterized protein n=1 Tax=Athelia psychrophila TaxID=1759441 RepID=A0A167T522_9AGAM|nr:hypothetical protein FIBSPDRAFT_905723 [Fibularhizoctonia sp. CBS 109695]
MTLSQSWQLQGPQDTNFTWHPPPGYRKAGWQPDTLEFRHYKAFHKEFLLHAPRPSPEVQQSTILKHFKGDTKSYWDNELQDKDIDIHTIILIHALQKGVIKPKSVTHLGGRNLRGPQHVKFGIRNGSRQFMTAQQP